MSAEAVIALAALVMTFLGVMGTVVFNMGRMSARLDNLEQWRDEMHETLNAIYRAVRGEDRDGRDPRPR